jgi:predicted O-methyltransferase YrrM
LYLLLRVLTEARGITRVLELGAGISTSLITQWVAAHDAESVHVDDDEEWLKATLPGDARSTGVYAPLANTVAGGKNIKWYDTDQPAGTFDLVLVDGPQAWNPESRFNRLGILNWMPSVLSDEFVVVVDDSSRPGEHQLVADLADLIERGGQPVHRRHVVGGNSQTLLASDAHRFAAYL